MAYVYFYGKEENGEIIDKFRHAERRVEGSSINQIKV